MTKRKRVHAAEFTVIQNTMNRVVCGDERDDAIFSYLRVDGRATKNDAWEEVLYWDEAEWREKGSEAFEAIMGVISKVANNERVVYPAIEDKG